MDALKLPPSIEKIFTCTKKSELVKLAKSHIVPYEELIYTLGYGQTGGIGGYHDFVTNTEWQPEEAQLTEDDTKIPRDPERRNEVGKFVNKMKNAYLTRKRIHYHLFYKADLSDNAKDKWHLIYLSDEDRKTNNNHWKEGPHFHFINYLWPDLDPDNLHNSFNLTRKTPVKGALHIRLSEQPIG